MINPDINADIIERMLAVDAALAMALRTMQDLSQTSGTRLEHETRKIWLSWTPIMRSALDFKDMNFSTQR